MLGQLTPVRPPIVVASAPFRSNRLEAYNLRSDPHPAQAQLTASIQKWSSTWWRRRELNPLPKADCVFGIGGLQFREGRAGGGLQL